MSEVISLIKSNTWLSVANVLAKLTSSLALPILARLLGPQSLGVYNVVVSLAQTVQGFSSLGIEISIQRNGSRHQTTGVEAVGRLFGVSFILICTVNALIALGVWCFRQSLASYWLVVPDTAYWLSLAAILAGLQPMGTVPLLFLTGLQDFRAYAIRSSLGLVISNLLTLMFTWCFGLKGAIGGLILSAVLQILWSFMIIQPVLQANKIHLRFDKFWSEAYSILKFGLPYYMGTHLLYSLVNLPLMGMVSYYSGLESLGYLRAAQSMAALAGFIPLSTAPAVISHLSAIDTNDDQSRYLKSVHLRSVWILLLLSTTVICLLLPNLMIWFFGGSYQPAIILTWLFLWSSILTGISAVLIQYLVADGKTTEIGWVSAIAALSWVLLSLVLIPSYGSLGFLISYLTSSIVEVIMLSLLQVSDIQFQDLLLLRNLTLLSGCLLLWTSIVFWLDINSSIVFFLSSIIIFTSTVFIFGHALRYHEQLKIKEVLRHGFNLIVRHLK